MERTAAQALPDTPVVALTETLEETLEETINRLMARHGDSLVRLCYMMLSDRGLAEDAVQDTFVKAWKAYPRFRHECSEYTWLTRIAVNTCRSTRARAFFRREVQHERPEDISGTSVEAAFPDDTVIQAVMRMKPKYKEPILLYYYQGLPVKEIAQALGIAVSSVSVRLMRARAMLKDELKEWYFDA